MLACAPDWSEFLGLGLSEPDIQAIRAAGKSGRPLGSRNFIAKLDLLAKQQEQTEKKGHIEIADFNVSPLIENGQTEEGSGEDGAVARVEDLGAGQWGIWKERRLP